VNLLERFAAQASAGRSSSFRLLAASSFRPGQLFHAGSFLTFFKAPTIHIAAALSSASAATIPSANECFE
jgi:hypothetical protein